MHFASQPNLGRVSILQHCWRGTLNRLAAIPAALCLFGGLESLSRADIFLLDNGGEVRGELANKGQSPRKFYEIKASVGGTITLPAEKVKQVVHQSAAEMEYDRIRPGFPDTVEGQWKLSEWCRQKSL